MRLPVSQPRQEILLFSPYSANLLPEKLSARRMQSILVKEEEVPNHEDGVRMLERPDRSGIRRRTAHSHRRCGVRANRQGEAGNPPDDQTVEKALRLAEPGVGTLVCGAISGRLHSMVSVHGIRVNPFVAGELDEIVKAWLVGNLRGDSFVEPREPGLACQGEPCARCGGEMGRESGSGSSLERRMEHAKR
jgi:hypothetical protein